MGRTKVKQFYLVTLQYENRDESQWLFQNEKNARLFFRNTLQEYVFKGYELDITAQNDSELFEATGDSLWITTTDLQD